MKSDALLCTPATVALQEITEEGWPSAYVQVQWEPLSEGNKVQSDRAGHLASFSGFCEPTYTPEITTHTYTPYIHTPYEYSHLTYIHTSHTHTHTTHYTHVTRAHTHTHHMSLILREFNKQVDWCPRMDTKDCPCFPQAHAHMCTDTRTHTCTHA